MKQFVVARVDLYGSQEIMTEEQHALDSIQGIIVGYDCGSEADIIAVAQQADLVTTNLLPITENVICHLPNCKAILRRGIGYDDVDVQAATEHGVMVINIPDFCTEELSNHAAALILASAKKLTTLDYLVRHGRWEDAKKRQAPMACIHGETLGIIGCGRAGQALACKMKAFGMKIVGFDKYVPRDVLIQNGIEPLPLDELLKISDYISLHMGLSAETYHFIGPREFEIMKPTATIINTSRGGNIDENALIHALKTGQIRFACLDVFEQEPLLVDNPLTQLEQVLLTPHSASYSDQAFALLRKKAGEEEIRVATGQLPVHLVNPQVLHTPAWQARRAH